MANKKQTYAALMKQLSNKKSTYEEGLDEARRMGNQSGIRDYERRLNKLNAGMDQLFGAQEQAKAFVGGGGSESDDDNSITDGLMAYGGKTKYSDGGFTAEQYQQYLDHKAYNRKQGYGEIVTDPHIKAMVPLFEAAIDAGVDPLQGWDGSSSGMRGKYEQDYINNPNLIVDDGGFTASDYTRYKNFEKARRSGKGIIKPDELQEMNILGQRIKAAEEMGVDPSKGFDGIPRDNRSDEQRLGEQREQEAASLDALHKRLGLVDPENLPAGYKPETEEDLRARLLSPNQGLVAPSPDAPPTPIQTGAAAMPSVTAVDPSAPPLQGAPGWNREAASAAPSMSPAEAQASVMAKFGNRLPGGSPGAWRNAPAFLDNGGAQINDKSQTLTAAETLERQRARAAAAEQARIDALGTDAPGYNIDFSDQNFGAQRKSKELKPKDASTITPFQRQQRAQMIGTALAGGAQLLGTAANMKAVRNMEGPEDMPFQRVQAMNTDIQTGAAVQQVRDAEARQAAALSANVSNPAVRAAMLRASQRLTQDKIGDITANEAAQEAQMRNQNLMNINDTLNQNRMIGYQNRSAQRGFENDRMAALNRLRNEGAQQIGGMASDFMRMQADNQRLKYLKETYDPYNLGASDEDRQA